MYAVTVLEARGPNQGVGRAVLPQQAVGGESIPSPFQLLVALGVPPAGDCPVLTWPPPLCPSCPLGLLQGLVIGCGAHLGNPVSEPQDPYRNYNLEDLFPK